MDIRTGIDKITVLLLANPDVAADLATAVTLVRQHDIRTTTGEPVAESTIQSVRQDLRRYLEIMCMLSFDLGQMRNWLRDYMNVNEPIVTHCICPPIPIRDFDWVAYRDPESRIVGYGRTEAEAIARFNIEEEEE